MIINNVKLVLEDEVVHGSLEVQDGAFRLCRKPEPLPQALDGEGGWLLPGLSSCIPIIWTSSLPRARR
jgi:alpha-D-ribose 1-methylphosphonate 5-triphosphate diphosphatase